MSKHLVGNRDNKESTIPEETSNSQSLAADTAARSKAVNAQTLRHPLVVGVKGHKEYSSFLYNVVNPKGAVTGHASRGDHSSDEDDVDREWKETRELKRKNKLVSAKDILIHNQVKPVRFLDIGDINRFRTEMRDSQAEGKIYVYKNRPSSESQTPVNSLKRSSLRTFADSSSSSCKPGKFLIEEASLVTTSAPTPHQESNQDGRSGTGEDSTTMVRSLSLSRSASSSVSGSVSLPLQGQRSKDDAIRSEFGLELRSAEDLSRSSAVEKLSSTKSTTSESTHSFDTNIHPGGEIIKTDDNTNTNSTSNNNNYDKNIGTTTNNNNITNSDNSMTTADRDDLNATSGVASKNTESTESLMKLHKKLSQERLMTLMSQVEINSFERPFWHDSDVNERSAQRITSPFGQRDSFFGIRSDSSPMSSDK